MIIRSSSYFSTNFAIFNSQIAKKPIKYSRFVKMHLDESILICNNERELVNFLYQFE